MNTAQDQQSRAEFDAFVRTHEQDHGALDEPSALAGWQAARALPAGMEPELHMTRKTIGEVDGFPVWEYEECCEDDDDAIAFFTAAQVLAMGRVPPGWQAVPNEPAHQQLDVIQDAVRELNSSYATESDLKRVYQELIAAAPRPPGAKVPIPSTSAGLERKPLDRIAVLVKIDAVLCKEKNPLQAAEEICAMANQGITHPTGD